MSTSRQPHPGWGWFMIALGCYPILIAFGVVSAEMLAPPWVVAAAGLAFVIGGIMLLMRGDSPMNSLLAGLLCAVFGGLGLWAAFLAPSELFSTGSLDDPFEPGVGLLSQERNVRLGRWMFGLGTLITIPLAAVAFRDFARKIQGR